VAVVVNVTQAELGGSEEEDDAFQEDWIWLGTGKDIIHTHL
jgi:hypothetical protein